MALDSTGKMAGRYTFRLFDIAAAMEYVIESNGIRSTVFLIESPSDRIRKPAEYRFLVHHGAAGRRRRRDIAALKGRRLRVRDQAARGGRLIVGTASAPTVPSRRTRTAPRRHASRRRGSTGRLAAQTDASCPARTG
jgi:hypothetical protein